MRKRLKLDYRILPRHIHTRHAQENTCMLLRTQGDISCRFAFYSPLVLGNEERETKLSSTNKTVLYIHNTYSHKPISQHGLLFVCPMASGVVCVSHLIHSPVTPQGRNASGLVQIPKSRCICIAPRDIAFQNS